MKENDPCLFDARSPELTQIINKANVGVWELDLASKKITWSQGFYRLLGYQPGSIACTYEIFMEHLIYHQDKNNFLKATRTQNSAVANQIELRLLTKGGYQWFICSITQPAAGKVAGAMINIDQQKRLETVCVAVRQTQELIKVAGWEISNPIKHLTLSDEAFGLLELEQTTAISIEEFISFFEPDHRPLLNRALNACLQYGRPFDLDLKLRTVKNNLAWIKIKAIANIDDAGKCITVKGVIQDIDGLKKRELALQSSALMLRRQNKRLQNFAHIVSHNLRSSVSNLQVLISQHAEAQDEQERQETFMHIKAISNSLTTTVSHLTEIVKVSHNTIKERTQVNFNDVFNQACHALQATIGNANAHIQSDFSQCPSVNYLPAYLDSILHNLLSNALKYRHPGRAPKINCYTYTEGQHCYLVFEDNGIGIDLNKHGEKIFGMYQTFHQNNDATGIGLFITRNQIESLGGDISLESTVDVGTKFIIRLV